MRLRPRSACVLLTLLAAACGNDDGTPLGPEPPDAASLQISPAAVTLHAIGDTARLAAEVRDQQGQVLTAASVTWKSLDAAVASVSGTGLVQAIASGPARVSASSGSAADTIEIIVGQVAARVEISPSTVSTGLGDTVRLAAVVRDANGHEIPSALLQWSSADVSVATVEPSGLVSATMQGARRRSPRCRGAPPGRRRSRCWGSCYS